MFESAGRFVYRCRWTLLLLALAAAVLVAPLGLEAAGRMTQTGFEDPGADSALSARWNAEWYENRTPDVVVLYRHPSVEVRDPRYRRAVHDSLRALPGQYVRAMETYWTSGSERMISEDGHSTYAVITLKGDGRRAYAAVASRLRNVENLYVSVGGPVPLGKELDDQTAAGLARAGAISLPVLLVLLVVVCGGLVAAWLPLLVWLPAVLGALASLRLLTEVTEVSAFSMNVVALLGLGLAVDYSLFVLKAFREEVAAGASNERAVARTMATAGRTVAFCGLTVATALLGLLVFPQPLLRSIGLGAAAVALAATGAALVVLPAVLGILGPRVNALRLTPGFGTREGGVWHAVASGVVRRPLPHLAAVSVVLVALALPFLHVRFGSVDHRALPAASESRRVAETLDRDFAGNGLAPIDVHVLVERSFTGEPARRGPLGQGYTPISAVTSVRTSDAQPLMDRLKRLPHVTEVEAAGTSQENGAVRLAVRHDLDPGSEEAGALVRSIRAMAPEPGIRRVVVGGTAAARLDLGDGLAARLPWLALVVGSVIVVLLFAALRSLVLPVKALLVNVVSLGASLGVVVWAFQDGQAASVLGFTATGSLDASVTVLVLVVVFALSVDHELFLLSRVRAAWPRAGDGAVAAGLRQSCGVITGAALLLIAVAGPLLAAGTAVVKLLGAGLVVALVVDVLLVRLLLVPAALRLLGRASWWLPWERRRAVVREEIPPPAPLLEVEPPPLPRMIAPPPPMLKIKGRPAIFGADTDPVPLPAEPVRRPEWVRVTAGRTRVVRADPHGGWAWVEVDE